MKTSKRLLAALFAFIMLVTSQGVMASPSAERKELESLLYVQYNKLIVENFTVLAIAKEDTNIYNKTGNVVGILRKDSAADVLGQEENGKRQEVISGDIKGFVDEDKLLLGKTAELRAVILLDETAQAENRSLTYKTREVFVDAKNASVALEILIDGVLNKAEPVLIEVPEFEVAVLPDEVEEVPKAKPEKKKTGRNIKYTQEDVDLLAAITYCEVGNLSYESKLAVANVVLNRVESKMFPNTIKGVIYARKQFSPVRNGRLAKALKDKTYTGCYKAVKAALNGENNVEGYYFFDNRIHKGGYKKIQSVYYWKTTF